MQHKATLFNILQVHSTCFGCQPQRSSGIHKTLTTATNIMLGQFYKIKRPNNTAARDVTLG